MHSEILSTFIRLRPWFCLFLNCRLRQALLYVHAMCMNSGGGSDGYICAGLLDIRDKHRNIIFWLEHLHVLPDRADFARYCTVPVSFDYCRILLYSRLTKLMLVQKTVNWVCRYHVLVMLWHNLMLTRTFLSDPKMHCHVCVRIALISRIERHV